MIFKNSLRLVISNFSNVWKLMLYYITCILVTSLICGWFLAPIIVKLSDAQVFTLFADFFSNIFSRPIEISAEKLSEIGEKILGVLNANMSLRFNYIFILAWLLFVFPVTLKMGELAVGEVLYGYMTSSVKYGFTGRYIKNIGKSFVFSVIHYFISLFLNILIFASFFFIIYFLLLGGVNILLSILCFALLMCLHSLKETLFSCWMPAISVLDLDTFSALNMNFRTIARRFFGVFSNFLLLTMASIVFNLIFGVFTASISLLITVPLTIFTFIVAKMVSFFSLHGMRFYVYPDLVISSKTFEEQDSIQKMRNLI